MEKKWNVEKVLKTIEDCDRIPGMAVAADVSFQRGLSHGAVSSGGFIGFWAEIDGKAQLYLIVREGETEEDYLTKE